MVDIIEIDNIPGNNYRLMLKVPRKNHITALVDRIPGINWLKDDREGKHFIDPWNRETQPVLGTIPMSQTPMLTILTTYYPIDLKFFNGCKNYVSNPPKDIYIDAQDNENLLIKGEFSYGNHYNYKFHRIGEKITDTIYRVPLHLYIAGIKYAEQYLRDVYPGYTFTPSIHVTPKARKIIEDFKNSLETFRKGEHLSRGKIQHLKLKRILREYQKNAVDFLEFNNGIGLIADEMGLGKTMTAISYCELIKAQKNLVVCPANVKYNWQDEIQMTISNTGIIKVLEGRKPTTKKNKIIGDERWVILNYDNLSYRLKELQDFFWDTIILDESHYIKNYDAKRSKAARQLVGNHRIALTGTPILNKPEEFWTTLSWLCPGEWGIKAYDYRDFSNRYGQNYYGEIKEEYLIELGHRLKNVMLRRLKSEVEDLPPKIRSIRHVALNSYQMTQYRKKEKEIWKKIQPFLEQIDQQKQQAIFMALQTLKRYASLAKTPLTMEVLREVLDAGGKVVVFSEFLATLNALQEVIQKEGFQTFRVDGSIRGLDRHEMVTGFQKWDKAAVFIGQIRAAGIGITLNSASTAVFNDFAWNVATHRQAEDRIHRIGQKNSCNIIYVSAKDTIDEELILMLMKKINVISMILDEKEETSDVLDTILKRFNEGEK